MTSPDAPRIIHEDEALRVIWQPGRTDHVVVSFGNLVMLADGTRFFGDTPLVRLGTSAIGVMAKAPHWFPQAPMEAASPAIRALTSGRRVLAFGSSMGGYGALKHSRLIGATHVLACEPQWSIDPEECEIRPGWQTEFRPEMAGMGIRADDISGAVHLLYDPWQSRDNWHARRIASVHPATRMTPVFGAGHHVVKVLSGTANLGRLLEACLADDPALMRRVCRRAGRTNPIRQANILERGVPAHPQIVLPLMLRANATQATIAFPNRLPELLTFQFHQQGAAACIALCNEMRPKIASNADVLALTDLVASLTGAAPMLTLPGGRVLAYDAIADVIGPRPLPLKLGQMPLRPLLRGRRLRLICEAEGLRLPVRLDEARALVLGEEGARAARFDLEGPLGQNFTLRVANLQLSVGGPDRIHLAETRPAQLSLGLLAPDDHQPPEDQA